MKKLLNKYVALVFMVATTVSCESTRTAIFDQYSYQRTTELKVETSKLMDKATTPYSKNAVEIDAITSTSDNTTLKTLFFIFYHPFR